MPNRDVTFIGLETYSLIGGLQNFNRRLIDNLAHLAGEQDFRLRVRLMRDQPDDVPSELADLTLAFGPGRASLAATVIREASAVGTLLVGHINLVPVAWAVKLRNPGLRLVLFVHGDEVWNDPAHRRMRPYDPFLLRVFDQIASVSAYTARRMSGPFRVPPSKFVLFPNAVDPRPSTPGHPKTPASLLLVSRLGAGDRQKNVHETLRAFHLVSKRLPSATLQIVGDGVMRPELEGLTRDLGLEGRVTFRGRVSDAELAQIYAESQVFAMPSSKEGFGIVYLEAWQYGLPVICGTEGAAHEIVSEGVDGIIRNPGDIPALADAIHALLSDPERSREMGESGHRKVASNYFNEHFRMNLAKLLNGWAPGASGQASAGSV